MDNIKDKQILLLCHNFYDYDIAIKNELIKLGAKDVFLKNAKFFCSSFREIRSFSLLQFFKNPFERKRWTEKFKEEINNRRFDTFLCIENACFTKDFMFFLKERNPNIKTVLFLWDTYNTQQGGFKDYRFLFDKVYTFDRDDASKYNIEYYPDFYIPQKKCLNYKYDISFVGTANFSSTVHRFDIVDYVNKFCTENNLKSYLYLKTTYPDKKTKNPFKMIFRLFKKPNGWTKVYRYQNEPWLHFDSLSLEDCNKIQSQSKVLLDINHKNRQGMTINAITALAQGQKLITTNTRIKDEIFYNPNMIHVMDEINPHIDLDFFEKPSEPIDFSELRLDNWLKHILR